MEISTKFNIGDKVHLGPDGWNDEVATIQGVTHLDGKLQYLIDWNDGTGSERKYPQAQMDDFYVVKEVDHREVIKAMTREELEAIAIDLVAAAGGSANVDMRLLHFPDGTDHKGFTPCWMSLKKLRPFLKSGSK